MNKCKLFLFAVVMGITTSGCELLGAPIAEKVADVVDEYCQEPQFAREVYRSTVNAQLAADGHSIAVSCAGDLP